MRAVVVYESQFGNTHLVADAIGAGLRSACEVSVVPVTQASPAVVEDADLVVVGGPTHAHGMTRATTRQGAEKMAAEPGSGLTLEPDAARQGVREWLDSLGKNTVHAKAAAFDTRVQGPAPLTGRAGKGVDRALRHHGFAIVAEAESFLVSRQNRLLPEESERARNWGARLAALCAPAAGSRTGS